MTEGMDSDSVGNSLIDAIKKKGRRYAVTGLV